MSPQFVPWWKNAPILKAAAITAGVLFVVSDAVNLALVQWRKSPPTSILNDVVVALIATAIVVYYLTSIQNQQNYMRAKERMNLTAELNHHLRRAMLDFRSAAGLEDPAERLKMVDHAMEEVDHLLIDLVPTVSGERGPRLGPQE